MVISNIHNDYDRELTYDENILKTVDNYKHLGVIISSNNKWSKHIDSITNSALKQISYLRKLKFHYENMPIQIYWNFYHQKMKIFR